MVQLLHGHCRACDYSATVGIGPVPNVTVAIDWVPASCPACGLVAVNKLGEARCGECGADVTLYQEASVVAASPEVWTCPECGEHALSFSVGDT